MRILIQCIKRTCIIVSGKLISYHFLQALPYKLHLKDRHRIFLFILVLFLLFFACFFVNDSPCLCDRPRPCFFRGRKRKFIHFIKKGFDIRIHIGSHHIHMSRRQIIDQRKRIMADLIQVITVLVIVRIIRFNIVDLILQRHFKGCHCFICLIQLCRLTLITSCHRRCDTSAKHRTAA